MLRVLSAAALLFAPAAAFGQDPPPADPAAELSAALDAQRRTRLAAEAALEATLGRVAAEVHPGGLNLPAQTSLAEALATLLDPVAVEVRPDRRELAVEGIDVTKLPLRNGFALPAGSTLTPRGGDRLPAGGDGRAVVRREPRRGADGHNGHRGGDRAAHPRL